MCARRAPCAPPSASPTSPRSARSTCRGPDAATFLDRVYTNTFSTLPVGKARYGLMLRDDGFLFDDGTTWRLAETRYLMTTTTANAGPVMEHLEMLLAIAWPELKVSLASVTDEWAGVAVAGPKSRDASARRRSTAST